MANIAITASVYPLADLRIKAGYTQDSAASKLGMTQGRISQIEREGTPMIGTVSAMATLYGVRVEAVIVANERTQKEFRQDA